MGPGEATGPYSESVQFPAGGVTLRGDLEVPAGATGVVLFAHGSGSGRHSPRNRFVARQLRAARLATLLLDLLTEEEAALDAVTAALRFDVRRLALRLEAATAWVGRHVATAGLPVGYFGASTGAAAALLAAARRRDAVEAVVSRGGRPDMAGAALARVRCPTLLLVGDNDGPVIGLNREALRRLAAPVKEMVLVPGAGHLFEEPGTLEEVARRASAWFAHYLGGVGEEPPPETETAVFRDRADAGRALAAALKEYAGRTDVLVLALPRGGVPVGFEVARALRAPLDVMVVRKLGLPGQEELAMGAIASGGVRVVNDEVVVALSVEPEMIEEVAEREWAELRRRERTFRGDRPPLQVEGKTILLVDDGLATGSTMRAAVLALRELRPRKVVVAVPVAPAEVCQAMRADADEVVCLRSPEHFVAVGRWYADFGQTTDEEVRDLLARAVPKSAATN
jgi:predicted phosphoribosyltransferase/pimeloyl-ACP methyl ester carboxylesterase